MKRNKWCIFDIGSVCKRRLANLLQNSVLGRSKYILVRIKADVHHVLIENNVQLPWYRLHCGHSLYRTSESNGEGLPLPDYGIGIVGNSSDLRKMDAEYLEHTPRPVNNAWCIANTELWILSTKHETHATTLSARLARYLTRKSSVTRLRNTEIALLHIIIIIYSFIKMLRDEQSANKACKARRELLKQSQIIQYSARDKKKQ